MANYAAGLRHPCARNLLNRVFFHLTVVGYHGTSKGRNQWVCVCKCGKERIVSSNHLLLKTVKACSRSCVFNSDLNIYRKPSSFKGLNHPKVKNLTGLKFGSLTVLGLYDKVVYGRTRWICSCDCGGKKLVFGDHLKRGATKYCSRKCPTRPKAKNQYTKVENVGNLL